MIPKTSWALMIVSGLWEGISIRQWMFLYPDLSNFIFASGFFLGGIFIAYDIWYKKEIVEEMGKDIQAIDKKCNDLETKIIELCKKRR